MGAELIRIVIGLFAIWLLSVLWDDLRADSLRNKIFSVRDELFDYAAAGNVSFDDPAYWMLRRNLNVILRFAHMLTFTRFLMMGIFIHRHPGLARERTSALWNEALKHVNANVREKLTEIHTKAIRNLLSEIILRSVILTIIVTPAAAFLALQRSRGTSRHSQLAKTENSMIRTMERIESQAVEADVRVSGRIAVC